MVFILPYIEQDILFQQWQHSGCSGLPEYAPAANVALLNSTFLKTYACPSNPTPTFCTNTGGNISTTTYPNGVQVQQACYVGIMGANSWSGYTETRLLSTTAFFNSNVGIASLGGMLFYNSMVTVSDVRDGTSNTMMVGEESDWIWDQNGKTTTFGNFRSGGPHGWAMGWYACGSGTAAEFEANSIATIQTLATNFQMECYNCTTIRYGINQKTGWNNSLVSSTGVGTNPGLNFPLFSAHTGGVNVLFVDGSVHFLSDNTNINTLSALATRDDGQAVTVP
jgi:prepilin-type processing-associated H-X9-DG protein